MYLIIEILIYVFAVIGLLFTLSVFFVGGYLADKTYNKADEDEQ